MDVNYLGQRADGERVFDECVRRAGVIQPQNDGPAGASEAITNTMCHSGDTDDKLET